MANNRLHGVFAPLSTPFGSNESLDIKGLSSNMERYAESGLHGFLALGSNGENKSLMLEEKFMVLEAVIKNRAKNQPVIAGCIAESLRETLYTARKAESLGCEFVALLPPNYFRRQMTDSVLIRYFTDVADAVRIPCILYNAPAFSGGLMLSPKIVRELASHPNIVGIKDSSAGYIDSYLSVVPDDFTVLAGSINNFFQGLMSGAAGGVISLANSFPQLPLQLYELFETGRYKECIILNRRLLRINNAVSGKGGVASVKASMDLAGFAGGIPRRPLLPLSVEEQGKLAQTLREEGLL